MPIKDQSIYPPYWKQFSEYIRFDRAQSHCELCDVKHGWLKYTFATGRVEIFSPMNLARIGQIGSWFDQKSYRVTTIVLTVAHLDHEGGPCQCKAETGRKCAKPDHVLALCQACHLMLDMPKHIENRRQTLITRKDASRGLLAGMEVAGA